MVAHLLKSRSSSESDRSRNGDTTGHDATVAVAIVSADPVLRRRLEQLPQFDSTITVVDIVAHSSDPLSSLNRGATDVVVMDDPTSEQLEQSKDVLGPTPLLLLLPADDKNATNLLNAGVTAVLNRAATCRQIIAAIMAAASGLLVFQPEHLDGLIDQRRLAAEQLDERSADQVHLTPREIEVLGAMADGASNKVIARRLNISFSTAKFHVASILAKLDVESRTEAVMKAAQAGLIML